MDGTTRSVTKRDPADLIATAIEAENKAAWFYRTMAEMTSDTVARATRRGYALGLGIIVPGVFPTLLSLAVRILPGALTIPAMAFLLKPRP